MLRSWPPRLTLLGDATLVCGVFGGYGDETVVLFGCPDGDAHTLAEGTDDESAVRAFVDEAVDTSAQHVEVRLGVGDVVADCSEGRDDAFAFGDDGCDGAAVRSGYRLMVASSRAIASRTARLGGWGISLEEILMDPGADLPGR